MTGVALALLVAGAAAVAVRSAGRARDRRRVRQAARDLPGAVSDLARSIRSGATLTVALHELAPTQEGCLGREVDAAVRLLDRGHPLDRVLEMWGRASTVPGAELLVAACRFSLGQGTALDRALDGVAVALLDRIEISDEVAALASQARTSALVLVALPPAGAALFAVLDPGFLSVLFGTTLGRSCLLVGVTLDAAGACASRALVQRALG